MKLKQLGLGGRKGELQQPAGVSSTVRWFVTLVLASSLGACVNAPVKPSAPAPAVTSLQEYMQQASKAATEGSREKARETYRSAAKAYPASKEPWIKLAEDYFEGADYGNAILAGQEVLLRDATDPIAASVLAVSGLRVSTSALQTLRQQNSMAVGTRSEAESMTRTLREVLGENVLVPRPETVAAPPAAKPRPRPRVASTPPASPPVAPKATETPAPAAKGGSPFDKLK